MKQLTKRVGTSRTGLTHFARHDGTRQAWCGAYLVSTFIQPYPQHFVGCDNCRTMQLGQVFWWRRNRVSRT